MSESDTSLKYDVEDQLLWDPAVRADEIAVSVRDGVVRLRGVLHTSSEKLHAERAARRVEGIRILISELEVVGH